MSKADILEDRMNRIRRAIALEAPDRTPVVLEYAGFAAHATGTTMAEFLSSPEKTLATMIEAYHRIGGGDAVNYGTFWPYGLCYDFWAKVRVPGVDLPADKMWQVVETELMKVDDYDRILEAGWPSFSKAFMEERILNDVPPERLPPQWRTPDVRAAWAADGVPVLSGGDITTPIEVLCGARSLARFSLDIIRIPDKVAAVMDAIAPHLATDIIQAAKERGYPAVWVGGWRSAPSVFSPAKWNRFAWPHLRRLVEEVVDAGLIAILHLDSDWTRELSRLRELPEGRCILSLDGQTDIHQAKKTVGDRMCIMGDVPAPLLYQGTPDQVRAYSKKLIRRIGPEGFILQSGCDIPTNAKLKNVQAMVDAAGA